MGSSAIDGMAEVTGPQRGGARALARQAMTAQVSAMAFDLFLERGYEGTTVDDICAVAGISRSTFFRYFASKEDALLGEVANSADELREALQGRPDDEAPWIALRRALDTLIEHYIAEPERALRLARLIASTPALAAKHHAKNARWHEVLRPEVARRLGADASDFSDPRSAALIAAALGCVDAAIGAWVNRGGAQSLGQILDHAMGAITQ